MTPDEITKQDLHCLIEKLKAKQLAESKAISMAEQRSDAFGQARLYAEEALDNLVKRMTQKPIP